MYTINVTIILTLILTGLLVACDKDAEIEFKGNDSLIFGHFYGECVGEGCVETYKLTDLKLYEDINDNYSGTGPFNFVELSHDKYNQVRNLIDHFPSGLLTENESVLGCPDCADQGGLFIRYEKNGNTKGWRIDQRKDDVPNYLHSFIDEVNEKIKLIND